MLPEEFHGKRTMNKEERIKKELKLMKDVDGNKQTFWLGFILLIISPFTFFPFVFIGPILMLVGHELKGSNQRKIRELQLR